MDVKDGKIIWFDELLTRQASRHAGVNVISSVSILKSVSIKNLFGLLDKIQESWPTCYPCLDNARRSHEAAVTRGGAGTWNQWAEGFQELELTQTQ